MSNFNHPRPVRVAKNQIVCISYAIQTFVETSEHGGLVVHWAWEGKMVVGVGFEPTNAEAGGFTVRILCHLDTLPAKEGGIIDYFAKLARR